MFKRADKRGSEVEAVTAGCQAELRLMGRVLERSQRPHSAESHGNKNAFVSCCCLTVCHAQGQKEYSAMAAQTDYCQCRPPEESEKLYSSITKCSVTIL